jgi:hypothetical protein
MPYREDPFGRIIACHFEDEDEPPEPEPKPPEHLCGFYERHNGIITWSRFNFITQANETVSMTIEEANAYAQAYYELHDPPGYPHDEINHGFNGFNLTAGGITWNTRAQPSNAFNVRMVFAHRFKITIHASVNMTYVRPPPIPPSTEEDRWGHHVTWTNFFDVSTWVWHPNSPIPIYIGYIRYPHGLGYSNYSYSSPDINGLPLHPPDWFIEYGNHGIDGTTSNLEYEFISIPPEWIHKEGLFDVVKEVPPNDPFDPSEGGSGTFWFMNLPAEGQYTIVDPRYQHEGLPTGYVWENNMVNTSSGSEDFFRIEGYCLDLRGPFD